MAVVFSPVLAGLVIYENIAVAHMHERRDMLKVFLKKSILKGEMV